LKPPYKSPTNSWYTAALFWELAIERDIASRVIDPVFSLHDDKPGLINARKSFVYLGDPSGYKWAMQHLGDWAHFKALEKCKWFREALEVWREELRSKIQSEAIDIIKAVAESDDKQALVAARYLAEYGWQKGPTTRGRPSKAEVTGALKQAVEMASDEDADLKRIGLVK
jgi:hypothetical protein